MARSKQPSSTATASSSKVVAPAKKKSKKRGCRGARPKNKKNNSSSSSFTDSLFGSLARARSSKRSSSNTKGKKGGPQFDDRLGFLPSHFASQRGDKKRSAGSNKSTRTVSRKPPKRLKKIHLPSGSDAGGAPWRAARSTTKRTPESRNNNKHYPWPPLLIPNNSNHNIAVPKSSSMAELDRELEQLAAFVQLSDAECRARRQLIEHLEQLAQQLFRGQSSQHVRFGQSQSQQPEPETIRLGVFGSFATLPVCTFQSDVDLALWGVVPTLAPAAAASSSQKSRPNDSDDRKQQPERPQRQAEPEERQKRHQAKKEKWLALMDASNETAHGSSDDDDAKKPPAAVTEEEEPSSSNTNVKKQDDGDHDDEVALFVIDRVGVVVPEEQVAAAVSTTTTTTTSSHSTAATGRSFETAIAVDSDDDDDSGADSADPLEAFVASKPEAASVFADAPDDPSAELPWNRKRKRSDVDQPAACEGGYESSESSSQEYERRRRRRRRDCVGRRL